jgi:hypothetical protein
VELDVISQDIPDSAWQRGFIEEVLRSPSNAAEFVPSELRPGLLVRSLSVLLADTPTVRSVDRSVIHLDGPEHDAVLFLHAYVIEGEPRVVGYDYRTR